MNGENNGYRSSAFPETRWTLIEDVRAGGDRGKRALEELCQLYWFPVYAYVRRSGAQHVDAEDLTQGFFERLLRRGDLGNAEAERGRLRSFLLTSLKHYTFAVHRKERALRRGGGVVTVPMDAEKRFEREVIDGDNPETLFERRWAHGVLEETIVRLESSYGDMGQRDLFNEIRRYLMAGRERSAGGYAGAAERLEMSTGAVKVAVHRMRARWGEALRETVAETVSNGEEVESELHHILRVLGG